MADEPAAAPIRSDCNSCGRETHHDVIHMDTTSLDISDGSVVDTRTYVVRCRGCQELSIREEQWYFDYVPDEDSGGKRIQLEYKPLRLWRRPPDWLGQLDEIAPDLRELLDEVYSAANDKQFRLLAMGVRTALDIVMTQMVGDIGGFEQKLDAMVEKGHLALKQKEMFETVIDAGSAAAHRGFRPVHDLLQQMLGVMETVIRDHYITGPMLRAMKTHIPPRPPRQAS